MSDASDADVPARCGARSTSTRSAPTSRALRDAGRARRAARGREGERRTATARCRWRGPRSTPARPGSASPASKRGSSCARPASTRRCCCCRSRRRGSPTGSSRTGSRRSSTPSRGSTRWRRPSPTPDAPSRSPCTSRSTPACTASAARRRTRWRWPSTSRRATSSPSPACARTSRSPTSPSNPYTAEQLGAFDAVLDALDGARPAGRRSCTRRTPRALLDRPAGALRPRAGRHRLSTASRPRRCSPTAPGSPCARRSRCRRASRIVKTLAGRRARVVRAAVRASGRRARVATVPAGYADGVPRNLGLAGGEVLVGGRRCPIVGMVTMDQLHGRRRRRAGRGRRRGRAPRPPGRRRGHRHRVGRRASAPSRTRSSPASARAVPRTVPRMSPSWRRGSLEARRASSPAWPRARSASPTATERAVVARLRHARRSRRRAAARPRVRRRRASSTATTAARIYTVIAAATGRRSCSATASRSRRACGRSSSTSFPAAGFRAVAFDSRGHGESVVGETGHSIDNLADDVRSVLEALDLRDAVLVGHSMGGMAVQAFAIRHPDVAARARARAWCCMSTVVAQPGRATPAACARRSSGSSRRGPDLGAFMRQPQPRVPARADRLRRRPAPEPRRGDPPDARGVRRDDDAATRSRALLSLDLTDGLPTIDVPTLVLVRHRRRAHAAARLAPHRRPGPRRPPGRVPRRRAHADVRAHRSGRRAHHGVRARVPGATLGGSTELRRLGRLT